jgi:hypothetical protein
MKLKEKIIDSIGDMDKWELNIIYSQIRMLEIKRASNPNKKAASIDHIRKMTSTSKSSWSQTIADEREDRA